jgi:ribose transport system substrate-binding protein
MRYSRKSRSGRGVLVGAGCLAAGLILSACGSASNDSSDSADGPGAGEAYSGPTIDDLTSQGLEADPPTEGPAPAAGKSVWWVSCGPIAPDCALPAEAAEEAAGKLGIDFKVADGKLNQEGGFVTAMETALAARPDAIIVHAMDCQLMKAQLRKAADLGIKTLAVETTECADEPLFTADMQYAPEVMNTDEYFRAWGKQSAEYLIAATDGQARVLVNEGTDSVFPPIQEGFEKAFAQCSGCEIVDTVTFTAADQVPNGPWIQRLRSALVKNPTANAVFVPSDYLSATLGGAKAAQEANPDLLVVNAGSGTSAGIEAVRGGDVTAIGAAHDAGWMGYAAMDSINRLLQDEELVPQGVGVRAVNPEANLPSETDSPYASPIDWKAAYDSLWAS